MNKIYSQLLSLSFISLIPASVYAHTGMEITGFVAGVLHPLTGLDHLLAMIAVGLWASQMGKKATWILPSSFIAVMVLGALLPIMSITVPYVETGILLSLLVLGGLIAATKLPIMVSMMIVGCFGLFHGYAHGAEAGGISMAYIAGFILTTAMLHVIGVMLGMGLRQLNVAKITRFIGGMIAMTGLYFVFA